MTRSQILGEADQSREQRDCVEYVKPDTVGVLKPFLRWVRANLFFCPDGPSRMKRRGNQEGQVHTENGGPAQRPGSSLRSAPQSGFSRQSVSLFASMTMRVYLGGASVRGDYNAGE